MTTPTLETMDRPLIHRVGGLAAAGMDAPPERHGQSVRAWVRSLDGIQKEGVTLSTATGLAWRFGSDEGAHLNGRDFAPNPLSFVAVGMAASFLSEIRALASRRGLRLGNPVLTLDSLYYRDGAFPRGTMVSGALPPEVSLACESDADPDALRLLLMDGVAASPMNGLVRDEKISLFTLVHNGRRIDPVHVQALAADPQPDPGDPIGRLPRAKGDDDSLTEKTMSEDEMRQRIAEDPPNTPVLDGSKKVLHLRTTCRLREDGLYECLREQYAQVSSSWRFVVDDRVQPARAQAPDAASYFAIGVAFCFMTQIGRYAHMAKLPLDAYRVVQDMHFTLGGATGGLGRGGTADAVETHVYMDSGCDDETARDIVRVAERTCFLHALCRDRAKVRLRFDTAIA